MSIVQRQMFAASLPALLRPLALQGLVVRPRDLPAEMFYQRGHIGPLKIRLMPAEAAKHRDLIEASPQQFLNYWKQNAVNLLAASIAKKWPEIEAPEQHGPPFTVLDPVQRNLRSDSRYLTYIDQM